MSRSFAFPTNPLSQKVAGVTAIQEAVLSDVPPEQVRRARGISAALSQGQRVEERFGKVAVGGEVFAVDAISDVGEQRTIESYRRSASGGGRFEKVRVRVEEVAPGVFINTEAHRRS